MFVEISLSRILIPKQKPMEFIFINEFLMQCAFQSSKYFSTPEAEYICETLRGREF